MKERIAYKCLDCNHEFNGINKDGTLCPQCNGRIVPVKKGGGRPVYSHRKAHEGLKVSISLTETDVFKEMLNITSYLFTNANDDVKEEAIKKMRECGFLKFIDEGRGL